MANIAAKDVMELRKQTDCGMMECKKALTEADGNFEKAIEILRERGLATAAKKASRVAAEGMVYADYCPQCKVGVVIEVNAETDFVAKNDKFVDFVKEATKVVMLQNPADVEALMGCKMGEGWLLTAEMIELVEGGYENIVCAQPFGCLPNHIVGKGMINQIRARYPQANITPVDYDPSATRVNQENRIKLMLANARGLAKQEAERREAGEAAHV